MAAFFLGILVGTSLCFLWIRYGEDVRRTIKAWLHKD